MDLNEFFQTVTRKQQVADALHIIKQIEGEDRILAGYLGDAEQSLRRATMHLAEKIATYRERTEA